jgi:hypothetical protein
MNAFEKGFHIGVWSGIAIFAFCLVIGWELAKLLH